MTTSPDLAGVRDTDRLSALPAEERTAWAELWSRVNAALTAVPT